MLADVVKASYNSIAKNKVVSNNVKKKDSYVTYNVCMKIIT